MNIAPIRRIRFFTWVFRELIDKYRSSLFIGLFVGLCAALILGKFSAQLSTFLFSNTLRIGVVGEFSPTTLPLEIQEKISSGLTYLSIDGSPQPALAISWEATNSGKLYTFHLRDDLKWHNGKSVSATDVNYNIRGVSLNAIDDKTLEFHLPTSFSPFPVLTTKPLFQAGLRGFGSYKVSAIRLKGDKVDYLKLTPVYNEKDATEEYRFYRTEALAVLAFKRGDIDILKDISTKDSLSHWGLITINEQTNYHRIVTLFFNQRKTLLRERALRHALTFATPEPPGERALSPLSKLSWAYTDKVKSFATDFAQAKKLFATSEIGTQSGILSLETSAGLLDYAQKIASSWTSLGIPTTVKVASSGTTDFDVLLLGQEIPPDPDQYPFWHSTQDQTNITGYTNVKIDKLLEDGRQEQDQNKRKAIYADFQRRLVDDAPAVFLYYPKTYTIRRGK